ncbi:MAG: preprotein translocase subunit SecA [Patescibacteria group bacterium]
MNLLNIFGSPIKKYQKIALEINDLEKNLTDLSDEALKEKSLELKGKLANASKELLAENLPMAFALVRESAKRTLNQRHYDVQLVGGMILHDGNVAEMKTGEGKTQMATLPTYLNALTGLGVHVVTVNDYLSRRDAAWMGQIYYALGLTTSVITQDQAYMYDPTHVSAETEKTEDELGSFKVGYEFLRPCTKREAYEADITYGTNSAFGFDYLFDNISAHKNDLRQRLPNYAIIDEADSILIDEARTPLIVSQPAAESDEMYKTFAKLVRGMKRDEHYTVDEKFRNTFITDEGITFAEKSLNVSDMYSPEHIQLVHHLETAIKALALYQKEVDYIIKDNEVIIVDVSTGRIQPGRRWSEGIHQAIEAKEGVKIQRESKTAASITYQNFFRLYPKLAGMTGTGLTSREEFVKVYGLDVLEVPTHKPIARKDLHDLIYMTELGKFKAIAKKIKELSAKGQPVLVGTVSIEKNELLSKYLKIAGVQHTLLNAKPEFAEKEGTTVAQAGKKGAVTIATNMAGRGVDIKLGGIPSTQEEADEIRSLGGLYVIGTERHEARRIDNQLRGRSGRQGDPGETQFYVSLEDNLMRIFANSAVKGLMARMNLPEDEAIQHPMVSRALESAQKKIEGFHFDSRKQVLEYDDVLNQQRQGIYRRRRAVLVAEGEELKTIIDEILTRKGFVPKEGYVQDETFYRTAQTLWLQIVDYFWMNHLDAMDHLRQSVGLRGIGQRDPLVEYKREGLVMFKDLEQKVENEFVTALGRI